MRSSGADDSLRLETPRNLSLDDAVEYLGDDELLEVTPKNYRLRKRLLNQEERKRDQKRREMAMQNDD
jgi:GTP-binding protein